MSENEIIKYRFRPRRATKATWEAKNDVLLDQEMGIEKETGRYKLGPGAWNDLPYQISGAVENLDNIQDGQGFVWNDSLGMLVPQDVGRKYTAGTGISIDNPDSKNPIINNTNSALNIDNRVPDYASLPETPSEGAGATYFNEGDDLIYIWDGNDWPADGEGLDVGASLKEIDPYYNLMESGSKALPARVGKWLKVKVGQEIYSIPAYLATHSEGDEHWNSVVSLLQFDGGPTSILVDEIASTWEESGNGISYTEDSPLSGPGSAIFPWGGYISSSNTGARDIGDQAATFEMTFQLNPLASKARYIPFMLGRNTASSGRVLLIFLEKGSPGKYNLVVAGGLSGGSATRHFTIDDAITPEEVYSIALCVSERASGRRDMTLLINGQKVHEEPGVETISYTSSIYAWGVGYWTATNYMDGMMDKLRVTRGVVRYTSNYGVTSDPFPTHV